MRELPEGWCVIALGQNVSRLTKGSTPTSYGFNYQSEGISFIKVENLRSGVINRSSIRHFISHEANASQSRSILAEGDVLFSIAGTIGEIALVSAADIPANTNQALALIRPQPELTWPAFLCLQLASPIVKGQIGAKERGGGMNNVSLADLSALSVVLPPLPEQRRIVAKLDALLSRVNACRQRLDKIRKLLARFRQSVLAAACSGKLTEDWRIGSRTDDVPFGWQLLPLGQLVTSLEYGTSSKSEADGCVPVLRMGNLQSGKLNWDNLVYSSDQREIERYSLRPGTVLFNRTNSPELVGKAAIYRGERPAIFAGYLIRINTKPELNSEYLNLCLNSPAAKQFCQLVKTDGVSQSNINARKLASFEVPFCSPREQQEIVGRVDQLFTFADRLEARVETARKRVDALTQSILAKAFRGELVPTEAELARVEGRVYESAAQLLERIASLNHREPAQPARKPRKRKPRDIDPCNP